MRNFFKTLLKYGHRITQGIFIVFTILAFLGLMIADSTLSAINIKTSILINMTFIIWIELEILSSKLEK